MADSAESVPCRLPPVAEAVAFRPSAAACLKWAAVAVGAGLAGLYLFLHDPAQPGTFMPFCVFHKLTGLHCTGCGTARAIHELLHGRLLEALSLNAATVLALPCLLLAAWRSAREELVGQPPAPLRLPRWFWPAVAGALIGFTVLRNVPVYPLTVLAP